MPFGSSQWMYSSGGFYPHELEQSLRFNDDDSAYLSWTPASAGNRKTWTWSGWVKRGNLSTAPYVFFAFGAENDTGFFRIEFNQSDTLRIRGWSTTYIETSAVYRDISAWYHVVLSLDTTQATASDRMKLYVNGVEVTSFSSSSYPTQNTDLPINNNIPHNISSQSARNSQSFFDGYLAEVNFIDGQALDATDFGEFKSGVWVAKEYTGTYGTNGFYLPFKPTVQAEGFNTVTWAGNTSTQSIEGVGFSPDLIWIKGRSSATSHQLFDTIRGASKFLNSDLTDAEGTDSADRLFSFDGDGFTMGGDSNVNLAGRDYVAWCWDAGSGSPVSNTDGSITSSVKANTDYGFSVVSWAGTSSVGTVGHGLGAAPDLIITRPYSTTGNWFVWHRSVTSGNGKYLYLNLTNALSGPAGVPVWDATDTTTQSSTSVFDIGANTGANGSGQDHIAYCWRSVSGVSDFGSYTGTGASGNTVTTGFKPAFVMVRNTSRLENWAMLDNTRTTNTTDIDDYLIANGSDSEVNGSAAVSVDFTDTGFTIQSTGDVINRSSDTYIYMAFADTRDAAFWRDLSGNDNDWQPEHLQNSDVMLDSPTNNWCVLNPLNQLDDPVFSEGNLSCSGAIGLSRLGKGTFAVSSGKWYFEFTPTVLGGANGMAMGFGPSSPNQFTGRQNGYRSNGQIADFSNSVLITTDTYTVGDVISIACDIDAGETSFYKNGVLKYTFSGWSPRELDPAFFFDNNSGSSNELVVNFGQDSSFAGNKTPQGNTDDNGVGDFYYAPPSGYLALCTANLPDPVIDPNKDDVPADYFNTVLYTGTGSYPLNVSGLDFQPDFVWVKDRAGVGFHRLFDAVRGASNSPSIYSNTTAVEGADNLTFTSDGFTYSSDPYGGGMNDSGNGHVAWNWLAGNSTSSNTDGSITSTVSVNQDSGFSIVNFVSTGSAGTVGHGLSRAPELIIAKQRPANSAWPVYSAEIGATKRLQLEDTGAAATDSSWNNTAPTSSVFSQSLTSTSGRNIICYCFHSVEGFSKFGSYTGNGSTDGPFVYCGFRPAFVMIKRTDSTGSWFLFDAVRSEFNLVDDILRPDLSNAELSNDSGTNLDFVSNGFKPRTASPDTNASSGSFIFMAFAEMPFKYSNAR